MLILLPTFKFFLYLVCKADILFARISRRASCALNSYTFM